MPSKALWRLVSGVGFALSSSVVAAQGDPSIAQAAPAAPAARVAIDPDTGKLRPVEHDDAAEAAGPAVARSALRTESALRQVYSRTGVRGVTLDESFMTYTVVRRNAQGGLESDCVHGESAAQHLLHAAPVSRATKTGGAHETQ
jgi:hypothetical protein